MKKIITVQEEVLINETIILEEGDSFVIEKAKSSGEKRSSRIKNKRLHDKGKNADGSIIKKGKTKSGKRDRRGAGIKKKKVSGKKRALLKKKRVKKAKSDKRSDREDKALGRK